jgi:uncharacterized protein YndB with AHSA1/START domain
MLERSADTVHSSGSTRCKGAMEMAGLQQSVVINRPVEQVFAFVSDLENDSQWGLTTQTRRTSPGPLGVGATFRQRDRFLGRPLELSMEVVGYQPDHQIAVRASSRGLSLAGDRTVEPVGARATRLTFTGGGHARGVLRLAEPLLVAAGRRRLRHQLDDLKHLLETQP